MKSVALEKGEHIFLAIEPNFSVKIFEDFDKIEKHGTDTIVAKISCDNIHKTWGGNLINIYNSVFIDSDQKEIVVSLNNWHLKKTEQGFFGDYNSFGERNCWCSKIAFIIEDPLGECRRIIFSNTVYFVEKCASVECLKFLNRICTLHNWMEYDIKRENEILKENNEALLNKIEELEKKLANLSK